MSNENERRLILKMVESGKITAEEGLKLLQALSQSDSEMVDEADALLVDAGEELDNEPANQDAASAAPDEEPENSASPQLEPETTPSPQDFQRWRRFWYIPLSIGILITIAGALLMYWAQISSGIGFWFFCSWVPFLIGLAVIILAWRSRSSRWLHLRVHQAEGEWPKNISISLPLPLSLAAWLVRFLRGHLSGFDSTSVDEVLMALENSATPENPLFIEVNEGDDGERVQIYIG